MAALFADRLARTRKPGGAEKYFWAPDASCCNLLQCGVGLAVSTLKQRVPVHLRIPLYRLYKFSFWSKFWRHAYHGGGGRNQSTPPVPVCDKIERFAAGMLCMQVPVTLSWSVRIWLCVQRKQGPREDSVTGRRAFSAALPVACGMCGVC